MADKFVKIFDVSEKGINHSRKVPKYELENLRGNIIILKKAER